MEAILFTWLDVLDQRLTMKRHGALNQGVWKQQDHGPSPAVCPFNAQFIILIVDFKLHPLVWQLTCHFFHIPRPRYSPSCSKVLRFGVCLIEAAGCSSPSQDQFNSHPRRLPTPVTPSHVVSLNTSVCLLWNIRIQTPTPPHHSSPNGHLE